jgi:hypothetical protein
VSHRAAHGGVRAVVVGPGRQGRGARVGTGWRRHKKVEEDDLGFVVVGLVGLLFELLVGYSYLWKKSSGRYIGLAGKNHPSVVTATNCTGLAREERPLKVFPKVHA